MPFFERNFKRTSLKNIIYSVSSFELVTYLHAGDFFLNVISDDVSAIRVEFYCDIDVVTRASGHTRVFPAAMACARPVFDPEAEHDGSADLRTPLRTTLDVP